VRLAAAALVLAWAGGAAAADPPPGRVKAQPCVPCHGTDGLSVAPDAPHLAGQPRIYLEQQLRDFRAGKRRHEVMNVIAKPLTDADIAALAEWYASIEVETRMKP
jgi:cytochrome c553